MEGDILVDDKERMGVDWIHLAVDEDR